MLLDELTEDDARAVALWRYPAPYDCYDYPAWERMERDRWAICDGAVRRDQFRALRLGGGPAVPDGGSAAVAGYVRFRPGARLPSAGDALAIHLGLRPDLCGRGLGGAFLGLVVAEARRRAGDGRVVLQVRRFNARAIAVYRRTGFVTADGAAAGDSRELSTMVLADRRHRTR